MKSYKIILLIIMLPTIISACGEVSYKRGASVRDVENAHAACRGVTEAEFSSCLEKQGWEIQKFDDSDLFAETSVTDNRGTAPANSDKSAFVTIEESGKTQNIAVQKEADLNKPNEDSTTTVEKSTPSVTAEKKPSPAPVDPLKTYKINSWWKFGGTPAQLKTDQSQCVANLGDAHQPDMSTQTYTRGLIECLHKNGWKALKAR
jgi:hypothetical protein